MFFLVSMDNNQKMQYICILLTNRQEYEKNSALFPNFRSDCFE